MNGHLIHFTSVSDTRGQVRTLKSFDEFCFANRNPKALTRKDYYQLFGNYIPKDGLDNNREAESVGYYTMLVLDYDKNVPTDIIDVIRLSLPGTKFLGYTTYNHKADKPKWRIVAPFSRPVMPQEYPTIVNNIIAHIGLEADRCSSAQAHIYYYASVQPGQIALWHHESESRGSINADWWLTDKTYNDFVSKSTSEYSKVDMAMLLQTEFSEFFTPTHNPNRFIAKGSESGIPGVNVRGGSVYIHHTQAMPKLANKYSDIYDLALELKFKGDVEATEAWLMEKGIKFKAGRVSFEDGMNTNEKVRHLVENHPLLKELFAMNTFSGKMKLTRDYVNVDGNLIGRKGLNMNNDTLISICNLVIVNHGIRVAQERILSIIIEDSYKREYNEVKDWITGTPWDGEPRLGEFWKNAGVPDDLLDNTFVKISLTKWMVGNCAMIFDVEKKAFDAFLLLVGETGTGKSHIAHCFGNRWEYTTRLANLQGYGDKDEFMNMNESIVVNFDEFETFTKEDDRTIKALTSKNKFTYRQPYDRVPGEHYRKWGYMGTSNTMEIIKDRAISRRLWVIPIETHHTDPDKSSFMTTMAEPYFRQQLWAEAYTLYQNNYDYQLTLAEIRAKETINESYKEEDVWQQLIIDTLTESNNKLAIDDVINKVFVDEIQRMDKNRLNEKRADVRNACKALGLTSINKAARVNGRVTKYWTAEGDLYNELRRQYDGGGVREESSQDS